MKNSSHPIPYRALLWLLLAALLCSLLPLLVLGRYDVPSADDFSYGAAAHQAYATTGSFFRAVAKAA